MSKRYRLLKDLPDAYAGITLTQDNGGDYDYVSNAGIESFYHKNQVENNPTWFEEIKPTEESKEWEIVKIRYKSDGKIWDTKDHYSIRFPHDSSYCEIYSVRRLSDGEVFSVGDELCELGIRSNEKHKITSMELINGTIGLNYGNGGAIIIRVAKKPSTKEESKESKEWDFCDKCTSKQYCSFKVRCMTKEAFTWTTELVEELVWNSFGASNTIAIIEQFMKSKQQQPSKERIEVRLERQTHRDPRIKPLGVIIFPTHGIAEWQFPLIKSAIESVLNNESQPVYLNLDLRNNPYPKLSSTNMKYTQQQMDKAITDTWEAARRMFKIQMPYGKYNYGDLEFKYNTLNDYLKSINQ
jgi:hypothetical protein